MNRTTTTPPPAGFEFRFTRRRYGRRTYTWAQVLHNDEWHELGDPWPGINWPKADLLAAAESTITNLKGTDR